jgi:hypothetical protein
MLRRITFMFGQPYSPDRLASSLRAPVLESIFGPMHIGLYLHASQMVRRGFAAPFDAPDCNDPRPTRGGSAAVRQSDLRPEFFRDKQVTLLVAANNQLWHRDSMDLMYEWLRRTASRESVKKLVFAGYNIQELLWGTRARDDVYPEVERAMSAPAP